MLAARTLIILALIFTTTSAFAQGLPTALGDQEFWRIVSDFSEPGGSFQAEFMSNEDSAQFVIPALKQLKQGGVYIGVGPEQNFSYLAAIQPTIAFIVDIRRDNMLEHLMYKAAFELSRDRADFLSRLFARQRPDGLNDNSSVRSLFDAYRSVEPDSQTFDDNLRAIIDQLLNVHKFALTDADKTSLTRIMNAFRSAGPYALTGSGDKNVSYAQMMAATDEAGRQHSYLASEDNFRTVQQLQKQNLIIPIVGDFAGEKALVSVGRYLKERNAVVNVFYVSNVERYLFDQGDHGKQFYANASTLPLDASSTFIRSVTVDISRRLGIPLPDATANWRSFLFRMTDSLKAFEAGRIPTYRELFDFGR
jgi:hypothetical protein